MYYIVSENGSRILDSLNDEPNPQEQADFFGCAIYVIKGEHAGLSAEPTLGKTYQCPCCQKILKNFRCNYCKTEWVAKELIAFCKRQKNNMIAHVTCLSLMITV